VTKEEVETSVRQLLRTAIIKAFFSLHYNVFRMFFLVYIAIVYFAIHINTCR